MNDYFEYTIAAHFLTALINGDFSGFTDLEEKQFKAWHDNLPKVNGIIQPVEDESFFGECEICGLYADCQTVRLNFHNPAIAEQ